MTEGVWPGSGGGVVPSIPIPPYQADLATSNSGVSQSYRNIPDVAAAAQNVYDVRSVCTTTPTSGNCASYKGGQDETNGGTSYAAPIWAGFMALINQYAQYGQSINLGRAGFANPAFYLYGKDNTLYAQTFHDISSWQTGNNTNTCGFGYSAASAGYDLATGWGSPQCGLIAQMGRNPYITVAASATSDGGPVICISGLGFSPGGTATVQYAGIPEDPMNVRVAASNVAVNSDGSLSYQDYNVYGYVASANGSSACSSPTGVVSVQVVDQKTGMSATQTMPASYWCTTGSQPTLGGGCSANALTSAVIEYNQVGACNTFSIGSGTKVANPGQAFVIFGLTKFINNTYQTFKFDPSKLYVGQGLTWDFAMPASDPINNLFLFPAAPLAIPATTTNGPQYAEMLGVPVNVTNGVTEANQTQYHLHYDSSYPGDPLVQFIEATYTPLPTPQNDCAIVTGGYYYSP